MAKGGSFKLFQNRFVLYVVLFLAITNILGYLAVNNWKAITYFIIISLIMNYFTKNMIIILGVTILLTNMLVMRTNMLGLRRIGWMGGREGMKNKGEKDGEKKDKKESLRNKKVSLKQREMMEEQEEGMTSSTSAVAGSAKSKQQGFGQRNVPSSQPASADDNDDSNDDTGIGKRIDYASTLEQAYDNLQNVLGSDGVAGLTKETQQLIQQQKSLMETMKSIEPMMKMAKETISGVDMKGITNTLSHVQSMMGALKK